MQWEIGNMQNIQLLNLKEKVVSMCAFKSKIVTKIITVSPSWIGYLGLEMVRRGNRPLVTTYAPTPETTPRT